MLKFLNNREINKQKKGQTINKEGEHELEG